MSKKTDIDIDVADQKAVTNIIPHHKASIIKDNVIREHNVGIYFQEVPLFLDTNMCSLDYRNAEQFFKIDLLTNTVYTDIRDENHMQILLNTEPNWDLLIDDNIIPQLFQIASFGDLLEQWKPKSVYQLAMFIAMIRPAKYHTLSYTSWDEVDKEIWIKPTNDKIYFKKSHSIAYATVIKIQLNLISGL